MKRIITFSLVTGVLLCFMSCHTTQKISYFQDVIVSDSANFDVPAPDIRLRPEDKISIIVNSRDPELTALFNLPYTSRILGNTVDNFGSMTSQYGASGYIVKTDGSIDFPVLGPITVAGMTRDEVSAYIKNELITRDLVKDPVVTVEFMNLQVSVMGEVKVPGRYNISRDRVTLLDAISMAGDLTIYGRRDNVLVMRPDSSGVLHSYRVDMRSFESVRTSPAYYLHQNDYVYVEPNRKRANESTVNGNVVSSASFWISVISLLATLANTITLVLTR